MIRKLEEIANNLSNRNIAVRVTAQAERMIKKHHPWVFENSIALQSHSGDAGDLAVIFDSKRKFLAAGLYDPHSIIRIRILQFQKPKNIDRDWYCERIKLSLEKRNQLQGQNTNGYRLIHGENDGFPGLVIDRYGEVLVIKVYTASWIPHLRSVVDCLKELVPYSAIIFRVSRKIQEFIEEKYGLSDGMLLNGDFQQETLIFKENGISFEVDPMHGHKTGFYLDQRENRALVEQLSSGKNVLNVFAYNGGFSLYAAKGGAKSVTSVDINRYALDSAVRNFNLNQQQETIRMCQHQTVEADAFTYLMKAREEGQLYDMVILDPPMFAHNEQQISLAIKKYRQLTRLGVEVLAPGGILVQASCSSRVSSSDFYKSVLSELSLTGRRIEELYRTGYALDHPVNFPEGEYLKCIFVRVC